MGRNTVKNVMEHNKAYRKKIQNDKLKKMERKEKLRSIVRKFNENSEEK